MDVRIKIKVLVALLVVSGAGVCLAAGSFYHLDSSSFLWLEKSIHSLTFVHADSYLREDTSSGILSNNSIVDPATISDTTGIRCCGNTVGTWRYPNGSIVAGKQSLFVVTDRLPSCTQLHLETDYTFSGFTAQADGVYKCNTMDSNGPQELFVGIYTTVTYNNSGEWLV